MSVVYIHIKAKTTGADVYLTSFNLLEHVAQYRLPPERPEGILFYFAFFISFYSVIQYIQYIQYSVITVSSVGG